MKWRRSRSGSAGKQFLKYNCFEYTSYYCKRFYLSSELGAALPQADTQQTAIIVMLKKRVDVLLQKLEEAENDYQGHIANGWFKWMAKERREGWKEGERGWDSGALRHWFLPQDDYLLWVLMFDISGYWPKNAKFYTRNH